MIALVPDEKAAGQVREALQALGCAALLATVGR